LLRETRLNPKAKWNARANVKMTTIKNPMKTTKERALIVCRMELVWGPTSLNKYLF
jgi:hypothetical protein